MILSYNSKIPNCNTKVYIGRTKQNERMLDMKRYIDGMVSDIKDLLDKQEIEKLNNIREEWINR